jgi:hypothetical protein
MTSTRYSPTGETMPDERNAPKPDEVELDAETLEDLDVEEGADQIRGGRADDPCGGDEIFSPKGGRPKLG